jgi:hypothetical protein
MTTLFVTSTEIMQNRRNPDKVGICVQHLPESVGKRLNSPDVMKVMTRALSQCCYPLPHVQLKVF